jgi:electron transport complex protein RnfB
VDAIVGAHRYAHTVVAALCTGCDLCLPACPVDCIVPAPAPEPGAWRPVAAA